MSSGFRARTMLVACAAGMAWLQPTAALADRIDGDWCNALRHFTIAGPTIVTPGGNRIQGQYDRHGFSYVVPANESGAGSEVVMRLINDENAQVRFGNGEPETWRRCKVTS